MSTFADWITDQHLQVVYDVVYSTLFGATRSQLCEQVGVDPAIPQSAVGAVEDYMSVEALQALAAVDAGMIRWVKQRMVYQDRTLAGAVGEARRLARLHRLAGDWRYGGE